VGDHFFIAAADCTGHGVPGAMVSVVCSNALNRAVKEFDLTDPGKILDKTTDLVLETFEKSNEEVKDGMDISLLSFKVQSLKFNKEGENNLKPLTLNFEQISWAGANNSLYYIEKGELKEIKANKQPIGFSDNRIPFTTHVLPQSLSALFLFTDGYADQFGGEKGKKFKYSNLQKLVLENSNLELATLNLKLSLTFDEWKGDLEQVDDVCIIGIKL
jgi:serine phosphatase RsbU (regulator of sigma subunit)